MSVQKGQRGKNGMKLEKYGSKRVFEIIRVAKEDLDDLKYKNGFNFKRYL